MKEFIDLYAKLVIGTFSFIGPSFTLLISLFFPALQKSREKHNSQIKNLKLLIQAKMANSNNLALDIKVANDIVIRKIDENKRELNLLSPKRQVRRLFFSLLSAILFIGLYYFQHSHFWTYDCQAFTIGCQTIRIATIALSGISFCYTLLVLWQIFCTIIRIKSEEEEIKPSRNVPLKPKSSVSKPSK